MGAEKKLSFLSFVRFGVGVAGNALAGNGRFPSRLVWVLKKGGEKKV